MLTVVQDYLLSLLPGKRKKTAKGWYTFSGSCCIHNNETQDKRGRAGVIPNNDGSISYNCYNCGFKTGFSPGDPLSFKFRKLLKWMGGSDEEIRRLVIEAIRIRDLVAPAPRDLLVQTEHHVLPPISFKKIALPSGSVNLLDVDPGRITKDIEDQLLYLEGRKVDFSRYDFYTTASREYKMNRRVIIPFTWKGENVGYTARLVDPTESAKVKYYTEHDSGYVFNVDKQPKDAKFVLVMEGSFDAMAVDGVATLGDHATEQQIDIIDGLAREVIVVPDFDSTGKKWSGAHLIDCAIECGWSVSFPVWRETCKDVSEAVRKYGKLFTLISILRAKEHNRLKIELMKKRVKR
jgi:hypothetical protein